MDAQRRVRRLRLAASDADAVRGLLPRLEDAFRCASLPAVGGRMLLVRRLALGRMPPRVSAQVLAQRIEQAAGDGVVHAVHGRDPAAATAASVWFADPCDAHLSLARRLLRGPPPCEWYWRLAVPNWRGGASLPAALRGLARSLAARPEAPVALAHWCAQLVHDGHRNALAQALRGADVVALARAAGVHGEARGTSPSGERRTSTGTPPWCASGDSGESDASGECAVDALIRALLHAAGMAAGGDVDDSPSTRSARSQRNKAKLTARPAASPARPTSLAHPVSSHHEPHRATCGPVARGRRDVRSGCASSPLDRIPASDGRWAVRRATPPLAGSATAPPVRTPPARPHAAASPRVPTAQGRSLTAAGGLVLLLNVLTRIGYPPWLCGLPPARRAAMTAALFARVLGRLGIAADDPAWRLAAAAAPLHIERFVAPECWRSGRLSSGGALRVSDGRLFDASGRLLLGGWTRARPRALLHDIRAAVPRDAVPTALADDVVDAWCVALRRWLRRHAGIGLADLVRRPARMCRTTTHLDVWFDHAQTDIRVRRAGVDMDPGWLDWYGRVVSLHYEHLP